MRMNTMIPLSVQNVDVPNALMRGAQTAGAVQAFDQRNKLFPGEMQQQQQRIKLNDLQIQSAQQAMRQRAAAAARAGQAAQLAAEAAELEKAIKLAIADPTKADEIYKANGLDDYVGMDARDVARVLWQPIMETVKDFGPQPEPELPANVQSLKWRAEQAGLAPGTPQYESFMLNGGPESGPLVDMSGANFGSQPDTRPMASAPEKGFQRRWDDARQTWVDEPIPGSAAQTNAQQAATDRASLISKRTETGRQSNLKLGTTLENINLNIAEIEDGGLPVTGAGGAARRTWLGQALTGSSAVDVHNRNAQVTDSAALEEISRMRQNSPTGGAVGALTDGERVAIGNAVTAMNTATSAQEYTRAAKAYRKLALDLAYGEGLWQLNEDGTVSVQSIVPQNVPNGVPPDLWENMTDAERALWAN